MMPAPVLPFDTKWLQEPSVAVIPGTDGWVTVAYELVRIHRRRGEEVKAAIRGFGCGPPSHAHSRAVGELVERYGASDPRVVRVLERCEPIGERLEGSRLHPAGVAPLGGWFVASGMVTGRTVWVPAALSALWYGHTTGTVLDCDVDATGLAAGSSLAVATEHGLCEVIERDAVGLWWRSPSRSHQLVMPPIDVASAAERAGLVVTTALVDSGGCAPVALACVARPDGSEATVGSACQLDEREAAIHAIAEAFMVRPTVAACLFQELPEAATPGVERLVWGWWHGSELLDRIHRPVGKVVMTNNVIPLAQRVQAVFGCEPIAVHLANVTVGSVRESVVRVFVPGAFRLESDLNGIPHGGERLLNLGGRCGGPHPFG